VAVFCTTSSFEKTGIDIIQVPAQEQVNLMKNRGKLLKMG
jgi:hypothetical protein